LKHLLTENEKLIFPNNPYLQYSGRIDFENPKVPVFIYPYSSVKMKFIGSSVKVILLNHHAYWDNYIGFVIDGEQKKILIPENGKVISLTLAQGLENTEHDLFFFKRMDSCHEFFFYGFILDKDAEILSPEELPARKIEVFGDSVSAGEVSEAVAYTGKLDPIHNGEYSNSYYSYAAIAARKLNAQLHNISQGGIALLHGTGWFHLPDTIGMEEIWDKLEYNPDLGRSKPWDFARYTPHVVLVAIGQNDNHPEDYMKENYFSVKSILWRNQYEIFVRKIRNTYPNALILLATTIMKHDENWDRSIGEVCDRLHDQKIVHFIYSNNGNGTPGHVRISEAEKMAEELCLFLNSFGGSIWEETKGGERLE
jgi:hypothetical protein